MIYLGLHDASDLVVPLGSASDHALRAKRMLPQLVDSGGVIARDLIGKRQIGRIEDACAHRTI